MTSRDHAIRARAFAEAALNLLCQVQLETIGAVGHLNDRTRAIADVMQEANRLLPMLDLMIGSTPP